jgi:hypothetical protein
MSIQQNFPAITPSLSLNFARSKKLDPRITFTRTSSATRINETGLVEVVPANAPRFDHSYDSVSGSVRSLGLLVEESRSNLLIGSEDIENSTDWFRSNCGVSTNITTAPNGTLTAEKIVDDNTINQRWVRRRVVGVATNTLVTASVFFKFDPTNSSARGFSLVVTDAETGGSSYSSINIRTNGSITFTQDFPNTTGGLVALPNGWYRSHVTFTNGSISQLSVRLQPLLDSNGAAVYQGDGSSGVFVWGAQLEQGAFPTSYIPTTNSTVTRTADNVSMVGENFSSWYNQSEGSIHSIISLTRQMTTDGSGTWTLDNGNFARGISLYHASAPNVRVATRDATFQQTSGDVSSVDLSKLKSCTNILKSVTSESISCHNGIFTGITTYSLDVNINRLLIGLNNIIGNPSNNYFNGTISQLTYYPRRLTNAQLVTLTR